jgi:hypothetical protein
VRWRLTDALPGRRDGGPPSDVRNGNGGRLCDRVRPSTSRRPVACRTAQATFDYLLAPPPRIPIIAVRRCSSVPPIIVGAVRAVVVADPFGEYVRTPSGFDHTPSPTRTVYSGLYPNQPCCCLYTVDEIDHSSAPAPPAPGQVRHAHNMPANSALPVIRMRPKQRHLKSYSEPAP